MFLLFWQTTGVEASSSYVAIDVNSGRLLEGSNAHAELPIASLTKVWTALTVLDASDLDEEITISTQAASQEGSSLYLQAGEVWTVESLLYGLLLQSGNDAAYALAEHAGGSVEGFVKMMNEKMQLAGLENSHFTNPSGLHHDDHYSSAIDMANMLRLALKDEDFEKIASAKTFRPKERNVIWKNKHKLLHYSDQAIAGKTGFTKRAGRTLVTYFKDGSKEIIVVTLNNSNDWKTHTALADNIFANYENVKVVEKGKYKIFNKEVIKVKKDYILLLNKDEKEQLQNVLHIPRKKDSNPYMWNVYINNELALRFKVDKIK
ncbi:D-alanyl-D-alanine carboxypeptidase family protein [Psychrobacillus sp. FJAT-21963]|uniref:D-alanyl-D-alanine carboxypeptidase family protein n=1 Tax=unclassified Psychrobacillus TaxID=2636677 RepID=UPI000702034A|nr:D-alanyl-D-alanine carboxypeptidase family protein [Psychrobacillus sp. FJAT-21963]KQL35645.1 D-alanyl-D-alanine carboxypeptidase [Psychrobacillus sp. FJAT-21963]